MKQTKRIKLYLYAAVAALTLSLVHLPATTSAAESCFASEDVLNSLDDPYRSGDVMIPVSATCQMKLYSMEMTFADADDVKGLNNSYNTFWHDGISETTGGLDDIHVSWNLDKDNPQTVDGRPYIDVEAGDTLFGYWYSIPSETVLFKHNMTVTIDSAQYEMNGEMKTVKNLALDAIVTITPDESKDVLMVSGIKKQGITYSGQPVSLEGELAVEENDDDITVEDLVEKYYKYDDTTGDYTPIERPIDPGSYLVEYSFENDNYRASLRVPFIINDYITVRTDIWAGHGEISAPQYVDKGSNLHVDIVPAEGYEVVWVEYNDDDVTELLNEDDSLDIENVNENAEIVVAFRPVYQVVSGDNGEYIRGSGNNLAFVVDNEPSSYTEGEVLIIVDNDVVDLDNDSVVKPEAQTITLLSKYLDTLEVGKHNVEIYFFDTGFGGIARATFTVVEAEPANENNSGANETSITVPDTGQSTSENSAVSAVGLTTIIVACSALSLAVIRSRTRRKQ